MPSDNPIISKLFIVSCNHWRF